MKSLRLHKYTDRLLGLTYDDLLTLTDKDLQKMVFTEGAKGKFMKQLILIRERPARIRELKKQLEEIVELRDLLQVLPEIEKIILMPLKAHGSSAAKPDTSSTRPSVLLHQQQQPVHQNPPPPTGGAGATVDMSAFSPAGILSRQEKRHDSGSDSGTELADDSLHALSTSPGSSSSHGGGAMASPAAGTAAAGASTADPVLSENVPQLLFELLEKTFSIIICKQVDDRDRDRVVLQFFKLVERRCLRREAFTCHHKQWFHTWLKRMDQVWDITKNVEASLEAKRKFERK